MISLFSKFFTKLPRCSNIAIRNGPAPFRQISQDISSANVVKDVILFSYENPRFFKLMNVCAISQYFFWCYFGHFCYVDMKDAPVNKAEVDEKTPWYMKINLGENKYRNTLGTSALIIGFGTLSLAWLYTLRSVRYLVLHKGGKAVSFVTYTPFGGNRIMKVDLKYVTCNESRHSSRVHLPLKVYRKMFFYLLDMRGNFRNPKLFDYTAGTKRSFDFKSLT